MYFVEFFGLPADESERVKQTMDAHRTFGRRLRKQLPLQVFVWIGLLFLVLFSIIPMLGVVVAFKNYNIKTGFWGMFTAPWAGIKHFVS
ncbi:MAG: hypothetical protein LBU67_00295 [Oscillospiraceae bacterium]|jgi:putative aldouronate transport system permease protein|nr:hypothetical protein [Oscillospiraceae bacterium]